VIEQSKEDIVARPAAVFGYQNLKDGYFFVDRFDEAENVLQQASARKLETADNLVFGYNIAFVQGQKEQMHRAVARAKGKRNAGWPTPRLWFRLVPANCGRRTNYPAER
jgi:predicted negative regulator of RcsB-dependent stress response